MTITSCEVRISTFKINSEVSLHDIQNRYTVRLVGIIAHSPNFTEILTLPNDQKLRSLAKLKYKINISHSTLIHTYTLIAFNSINNRLSLKIELFTNKYFFFSYSNNSNNVAI